MAYALIDHLHDQGVRIVVVTACSVVPQARERPSIVPKPFSEAHLLAALCEAAFETGARAPKFRAPHAPAGRLSSCNARGPWRADTGAAGL